MSEKEQLYSYLNLESTKTMFQDLKTDQELYSYLNLESTKTVGFEIVTESSCTVT